MPKSLTGHRIDWGRVRSEFVTGSQIEFGRSVPWTYSALAKHFNISCHSISKRATDEGWQLMRDEHYKRMDAIIERKRAEQIAAQAAKFDREVFELAKDAINILRGKLCKRTTIFDKGVEVVKEEIDLDLSPIEIRRVLEAADIAQCIREKAVKVIIEKEDDSILQLIKIIENKREEDTVTLQLPSGDEIPVLQGEA